MAEIDECDAMIEKAMEAANEVWLKGMCGDPKRTTLGHREVPLFAICEVIDLKYCKGEFNHAILKCQQHWRNSYAGITDTTLIAKDWKDSGINVKVGIPALDEHGVHVQFCDVFEDSKYVRHASVFHKGTWRVSIGNVHDVGNYDAALEDNDFVLENRFGKFELHHFIYPDNKCGDCDKKAEGQKKYLDAVKAQINESIKKGYKPYKIKKECGVMQCIFQLMKAEDERLTLWG